jgi:putative flippase GtrA
MFKLCIEAAKYAAASAVAYVADAGLLFVLTRHAGWNYEVAAALSFLTGACVAYALSVSFVFSSHRLHSRGLEFAWFVALGLVGMAVNALMLYVTVSRLGLGLMLAKAITACCTCLVNFALRRQLLFRAAGSPA